jgi:DNA-binding MltR family transcriptional regulator
LESSDHVTVPITTPSTGLGYRAPVGEKMKDDINPFEASNRLNEITRDLDERGLVLTLAAFGEEALGELLGQFMIPGDAANALLKGFNAPLGTFSARIKAALALGLLTKRQQENLERLRRIRNEFAHGWEPITFDNQAVTSHIAALHYTPLVSNFPTTKIRKVRDCISSVLVEIGSTTNQIRMKGCRSSNRQPLDSRYHRRRA